MEVFALGFAWYIAFLVSTILHEASHAWIALRLGDSTAYQGGQVTIDPLPHIRREPVGMVVVPIVSYIVGGWIVGWGSCPYDPAWALEYPRRSGWMSFAGPAANLLIILFCSFLIRLGLAFGFFVPPDAITINDMVAALPDSAMAGPAQIISIFLSLNLVLFTFNLLPIPPMDGSALPLIFLQRDAARKYLSLLKHPGFYYVGILIAWHIFGGLFRPIRNFFVNLLYLGITHYG